MATLRHHARFLIALAFGLAVFAVLPLPMARRGLLAFDGFALAYLGLILRHLRHLTPQALRRRAETEDEGIALIALLAVGSVAASLAAIWLVLGHGGDALALALSLVAVPLGWAMVHTLAAFHYAHLHYAPDAACHLTFPDTKAPEAWDFLYFAFTIGMAAQTSDVAVASARMRRVVLVHGVASFFYNTVILALAVNAGVQLAG